MRYLKYILLLFATYILTSCEEDIIIPLNTAEPRLVIDAALGDKMQCDVHLTLTQDYWNQNYPTSVSGATVTLSDNAGKTELLEYLGDGRFTSKMNGQSGKTYTLTVEYEGEKHVATEYLPYMVPILDFRTYKMDTGGDVYFYPVISYVDPKGIENYYYYSLVVNGRLLRGIRYDDDKYSDGKLKEVVIFFDDEENDERALCEGDYVSIQLQSIGKGAHTFFKSQSAPGGFPDANPVSNFSGDVLGMFKTFSAYTLDVTITKEDLQE